LPSANNLVTCEVYSYTLVQNTVCFQTHQCQVSIHSCITNQLYVYELPCALWYLHSSSWFHSIELLTNRALNQMYARLGDMTHFGSSKHSDIAHLSCCYIFFQKSFKYASAATWLSETFSLYTWRRLFIYLFIYCF